MPHAAYLQDNFLGGEWSPTALGRATSPRYSTALARCLNMLPKESGALTRRSALTWHGLARSSATEPNILSALIAVPSSANALHQNVIIEISSTTLRFRVPFQDQVAARAPGTGHQVVTVSNTANKTITAVTNANPAVVTTSAAHNLSNGDRVLLGVVPGMPGLSNREVTVTVLTSTTFSIGINTTSTTDWGAFDSSAAVGTPLVLGKFFELTGPSSMLADERTRVTVLDNRVFLWHPQVRPQVITFWGSSGTLSNLLGNISIAAASFVDGPYLAPNTTNTTVSLSGTSGSVTLTFSASQGFTNDDIGRWVRITDTDGNTDAFQITARNSGSEVVATALYGSLTSTSATAVWRLGVWSATLGPYPGFAVFHEGRLWINGGGDVEPNRMDGSEVDANNFVSFKFGPTNTDGTTSDATAVSFKIRRKQSSIISWLVSHENGLLVGTTGGVILYSGADGGQISTTSIASSTVSTKSCARIEPAEVGRRVLFVEGRRRRIYEIDPRPGASIEIDLTAAAQHLTGAGKNFAVVWFIRQIAWSDEPDAVLWVRMADGRLLGMSYYRSEDQLDVGWHEHTLAQMEVGATVSAPQFLTLAVAKTYNQNSLVTRNTLDFNQLWAVISRQDGSGNTIYSLDFLYRPYEDVLDEPDISSINFPVTTPSGLYSNQLDGAQAFDSRIYYVPDASSTFKVGNLQHYNGCTLRYAINGIDVGTATVANGTITVTKVGDAMPNFTGAIFLSPPSNYSAWLVTVGAPFNSDFQLPRPDEGAANGTSIGKTRRVNRYAINTEATLGLQVGTDFDHLKSARDGGSAVYDGSTYTELYSGMTSDSIDDTYSKNGQICGRIAGPHPGTILSVTGLVDTREEL